VSSPNLVPCRFRDSSILKPANVVTQVPLSKHIPKFSFLKFFRPVTENCKCVCVCVWWWGGGICKPSSSAMPLSVMYWDDRKESEVRL